MASGRRTVNVLPRSGPSLVAVIVGETSFVLAFGILVFRGYIDHIPHDLLDAVQQRLGRVVKQQMRFVEEKHQLWLVEVANLGQLLEQFGQKPQ